jgi:hypothetical protein
VGIDISQAMIDAANEAKEEGASGMWISFKMDAAICGRFRDGDVQRLHALDGDAPVSQELGLGVLKELKRISRRSSSRITPVPSRTDSAAQPPRIIERFAGREHHRNFRAFIDKGGLGRCSSLPDGRGSMNL